MIEAVVENVGDASQETISDPYFSEQWGLAAVKATSAWSYSKTSGAVTVAIIDTGVDYDHPDLENSLILDYAKDTYTGDTGGAAVDDVKGHGTHVVGIVAAEANNGLGIAGVSHNAKILPIKVSHNADGEMYTSDVIEGIDYVVSLKNSSSSPADLRNIRVINMSLGGEGSSSSSFQSAVNRAAEAGILCVASVGSAASYCTDYYPAAYDGVLAVAALKQTSTSFGYAVDTSYSNYGPYVDISAPGTSIYSTVMSGSYDNKTGTSMAAPAVSGVAALLYAQNMSLTPENVTFLIQNTAIDLEDSGRDDRTGYGAVNAYAAVYNRPIAYCTFSIIPDQAYTGEAVTPDVTVKYGSTTLIEGTDYTLSYSDNVDVGEATVTIEGIGRSAGSAAVMFEIAPEDISSASISAIPDQTYTGSAIEPKPSVAFNGEALIEGEDYEVSYSNNVGVGIATLTLTGKGNFTGAAEAGFEIVEAPIAWGRSGNCTWRFDSGGMLVIAPIEGTDGTLGSFKTFDGAPWHRYCNSIESVVVEEGVVALSTKYMFYGCKNLERLDLSSLDVSSATDMSHMFSGCSSLTSLDISGWDTSSVTDMSQMFSGCSSLTSLDLSGWDTSSVAYMGNMFNECSSLVELDVSNWDVSSVKRTFGLFYGCSALAELDLSGWKVSRAEQMHSMFANCSSLEALDLSDWDVSSATHLNGMFSNCTALTELDLSGWDTSSATYVSNMLFGCDALAKLSLGAAFVLGPQIGLRSPSSPQLWRAVESGTSDAPLGAGYLSAERLLAAHAAGGVEETYVVVAAVSVPTVAANLAYTGSELTGVIAREGYTLSGVTSATDPGSYDAIATLHPGSIWADCSTYPKVITWSIEPAAISAATVAGIPGQAYTGSAVEPEISVSFNGDELVEDVDYEVSYENNVNAGTAAAIVVGAGNFAGETTVGFEIEPAVLTAAYAGESVEWGAEPSLAVSVEGFVSGEDATSASSYEAPTVEAPGSLEPGASYELTPAGGSADNYVFSYVPGTLSVGLIPVDAPSTATGLVYTGAEVTGVGSGEGYSVEGGSAVDADDYVATATLEGGHMWADGTTGDLELSWSIAKAAYDVSGLSFDDATLVYDGASHTIEASGVPEGVTVSYVGNGRVEAGSYAVVASFGVDANHKAVADMRATLVIEPAAISSAAFSGIPAHTYTGKPVEPGLSFSFNGKALVEGVDYDVEYADNVNVGTAVAAVTGKGNFTGEAIVEFEIEPISVDVPTAASGLVYNGTEQVGVPAGEGYSVENGSAVGAGSYTATATLSEGYVWSDGMIEPKEISWFIAKAAYDMSGVSLVDATVVYDGQPHSIEVSGDLPADVAVSYDGNDAVNAGTHEVIAIFTSDDVNYKAIPSMTATLRVEPAAISSAAGLEIEPQAYTGSAVEPGLSLSFNGVELTQGVDYEVSYADNVNVGTAVATVTGKGNFTGEVIVEFEIEPISVEAPAAASCLVYAGSELTGVDPGEGFAVQGGTATDAGSYTATATLLEGYKWSDGSYDPIEVTWSIAPADIALTTASAVPAQAYTGSAIEPELSLSFNGAALASGDDYEASYSNNLKVGTATATVKGKGNFTGELAVEFRIVPYDTVRIAGANRYATMAAIVSEGFAAGSCEWAIVASGENFPDALAASSLAGALGAPIVLTAKGSLSLEAAAEIKRIGATQVLVIGGTGSVSDVVLRQLRSVGSVESVERVSGSDRYATSFAIYEKGLELGVEWSDSVVVATGSNFADALSVSPWAYATSSPIFLSNPTSGLSVKALAAIARGGFSSSVLVGGTGSVPASAEEDLTGMGLATKRLAGSDRYATSSAIAKWATETGALGVSSVAFATGENFPDALAGGALCGKKASALLLVKDERSALVTAGLAYSCGAIDQAYIIGGVNSVSEKVVDTIGRILFGQGPAPAQSE